MIVVLLVVVYVVFVSLKVIVGDEGDVCCVYFVVLIECMCVLLCNMCW